MPCCKNNLFCKLYKSPRSHVHSGESLDTVAHTEALLSLHVIIHLFIHLFFQDVCSPRVR